MRRLLVVLPNKEWKVLEPKISKDLPLINDELLLPGYGLRITKAYFTKDFEDFQKKYPFVCVGGESTQKQLIKAEARYPSEVKQGVLYMGNMMNVLDKNND
jgi:hypothetical protein